jgi:hypothetical protein
LMTSLSICPLSIYRFLLVNRCVDIPLFLPDPLFQPHLDLLIRLSTTEKLHNAIHNVSVFFYKSWPMVFLLYAPVGWIS